MASVTLCPPNPKEFESATSTWRFTEVAGGIGRELVDGRRDDPDLDDESADACLEGAGGTEQMPGHRLGGAEDELTGAVTEHGLHGGGLGGVAVRRRGPVGVDVADVIGLDSPVAHREAHRFLGS